MYLNRDFDAKHSPAILSFIAILLWFDSLIQAKLNLQTQCIKDIGLITILPLNFFIALLLLTVSFFWNLKSKKDQSTFLFQIIILIIFLRLTPAVIEETPRFSTTYENYKSVDYISKNGNTNPSRQWIHNWPGFSILYSIFVQITNLPELYLLIIYPTLFNLIFLLPLYIFFRSVTADKIHKWIAIWIFYIANWTGQDYFCMQSQGFFTFVLILYIMFRKINVSSSQSHLWIVLSILLFSFVTFTHMFSSFIMILVTFMLYASRNLRTRLLFYVFIVILASWTIHGAIIFLKGNLLKYIMELLNFELIYQTNVGGRIAGSWARIMVTRIRMLFSIIIVIFSFFGLIWSWMRRKFGLEEKKFLLTVMGVLMFLSLFAYGGEIVMRIYLFSLIPISFFILKGLDHKIFFGILMMFLATAASPLYIISHYGNEIMDYVPPSEMKGARFLYNSIRKGYIVGNFRDFRYRYYPSFKLSEIIWDEDENILKIATQTRSVHKSWPKFVCISYGIRERVNFAHTIGKIGFSPFVEPDFITELYNSMSSSVYYNRIYSNPSFDIYFELQSDLTK